MRIRRFFSAVMLLYVIVGSWKGYVALFDEDQTEPKQIFPYKVSSLPTADQQALEEGILVRNDRDLKQLLEDYLS